MLPKAKEHKTSDELLDIAHKLFSLLIEKQDLTNAEVSIVIFIMGDGHRYTNEAQHIERRMKHAPPEAPESPTIDETPVSVDNKQTPFKGKEKNPMPLGE